MMRCKCTVLHINFHITPVKVSPSEQFICKLYNLTNVSNTNEARVVLFNKSRSPESLPPTSDALHFHICTVCSLSSNYMETSSFGLSSHT